MKKEKMLLLGEEKSFITSEEKFSCQYGSVNLANKKSGEIVSIGKKKFVIVSPSMIDLLKKAKRMPQVVLPKDAASILAVTGAGKTWECLDAGSGSGFLSIFLSPYVKKITTYEKNSSFFQNVKRNIEFCGISNIDAKNMPVQKFTEKNLDLITFDIMDAEKLVSRAYNALKSGGWLCIYAPQLEQHMKCVEKMQKKKFTDIQTLENIQRKWKIDTRGFSHPHHTQVVHTGFLTFGRKLK